MKILKKIFVFLICFLVCITPFSSIYTEAAVLKDVKKSNPQYVAIEWAVDQKLMQTEVGGKFQPTASVTELQLMKMIAKLDGAYPYSFTTDLIYQYYGDLNLPLNGVANKAKRNANVTRGQFARIYASINGLDLSEAQAIQFMYINEITKGTTGKKTYNDFAPRKKITKGDLAVFLYRMAKENGISVAGLESAPTGKDNANITLPASFKAGGTVILDSPSGSQKNDASSQPNAVKEVQNILVSSQELIANGKDSSLIVINLKDKHGNEIDQDTSLQFKATSSLGAKFSTTQKTNRTHTNVVETDGGELSIFVTAPRLSKSSMDTITFELINNSDPKFAGYKDIKVNLKYVPKPELQIAYEVYDPEQQEWIENEDLKGANVSPLPLFEEGKIQLTDLNINDKTFRAYAVDPAITFVSIVELSKDEFAVDPAIPSDSIVEPSVDYAYAVDPAIPSDSIVDPSVDYEFASLTLSNQKISNWLFEQIMDQQISYYEITPEIEYSIDNGQPKYNFNFQPAQLEGREGLIPFDSPLSATFYYLLDFIPDNQNELTMIHYDSVKAIKAIYDNLSSAEKEFLAENYSKEVAKLNTSNSYVDTLRVSENIADRPFDMEKYTKIIVSLVEPGGKVVTDYRGTVNITYNGISHDVPFNKNTTNYQDGTGHAGAAVFYTDSVIEGKSVVTANLSSSNKDSRYASTFNDLFGKDIKETIFVNPKFKDNKCMRETEVGFVVDQSGSMKKNDPENYVSLKTRQLINQLDARHNIAIRFNTKAHVDAIGTKNEVLSKTNLFHESNIRGGTNIASGINLALSNFTTSASSSKSIILVSDGKTTKKQINQVIQAANKQNVKVFAVAVGEQKNANLTVLKELANSTGGQFYHIDEIEKLHEAYQVIIDAILCQTIVPVNSCVAADSLFTDVQVENRGTYVVITAILNINCGNADVEKVGIRYNAENGEYHYGLVSRGQNVYRRVEEINRFQNFILDNEVEFIAYGENGNILGTKIYHLN